MKWLPRTTQITPPPATLIFPLTQSLPLPDAAGPSTSVAPMTTPDVHFQTLSRINFALYNGWPSVMFGCTITALVSIYDAVLKK